MFSLCEPYINDHKLRINVALISSCSKRSVFVELKLTINKECEIQNELHTLYFILYSLRYLLYTFIYPTAFPLNLEADSGRCRA